MKNLVKALVSTSVVLLTINTFASLHYMPNVNDKIKVNNVGMVKNVDNDNTAATQGKWLVDAVRNSK